MEGHEEARLGDTGPERIELRQERRKGAAGSSDRGRAEKNDFGASVEQPVEFGDGAIDDARIDDRCGENAIAIVKCPLVVEPFVEGVHKRRREFGIVSEMDLEEARQSGEHERGVETQFV